MTTKTMPAPPAEPPADPPAEEFRPSPEVGEVLRGLHAEQAEVDRRKAEELARLREIQDRD